MLKGIKLLTFSIHDKSVLLLEPMTKCDIALATIMSYGDDFIHSRELGNNYRITIHMLYNKECAFSIYINDKFSALAYVEGQVSIP